MAELGVYEQLGLRIQRAQARYGDFASTHEVLGVAYEEWQEFTQAVIDNDVTNAANEALDLAAVLIRFAEQIKDNENDLYNRSVK